MAQKKKTKLGLKFWLWAVIGIVAGFFAFGPWGVIPGVIGGVYFGWHAR